MRGLGGFGNFGCGVGGGGAEGGVWVLCLFWMLCGGSYSVYIEKN